MAVSRRGFLTLSAAYAAQAVTPLPLKVENALARDATASIPDAASIRSALDTLNKAWDYFDHGLHLLISPQSSSQSDDDITAKLDSYFTRMFSAGAEFLKRKNGLMSGNPRRDERLVETLQLATEMQRDFYKTELRELLAHCQPLTDRAITPQPLNMHAVEIAIARDTLVQAGKMLSRQSDTLPVEALSLQLEEAYEAAGQLGFVREPAAEVTKRLGRILHKVARIATRAGVPAESLIALTENTPFFLVSNLEHHYSGKSDNAAGSLHDSSSDEDIFRRIASSVSSKLNQFAQDLSWRRDFHDAGLPEFITRRLEGLVQASYRRAASTYFPAMDGSRIAMPVMDPNAFQPIRFIARTRAMVQPTPAVEPPSGFVSRLASSSIIRDAKAELLLPEAEPPQPCSIQSFAERMADTRGSRDRILSGEADTPSAESVVIH